MTDQERLKDDLYLIRVDPMIKFRAPQHFFAAMQEGYAAEPEKRTIPGIPGSKTIEYSFERWRVLDTYIVSPQSTCSGGTTYLWYADIPLWMMQYMGWYDDGAIPCLRAALRQNYEASIFLGGRGPEFFRHESDYFYQNTCTENNFFGRTTGKEFIFGPNDKIAGVHFYQAMWMVKD